MRIVRTNTGKLFVRAVMVRIFHPGNKTSKTITARAASGKLINEAGIFKVLGEIVDKVEKQWPDQDYKLVQLGPSTFNIVWLGKKADATMEEGRE